MNPIKITNFKSGEILFYKLQKFTLFTLTIAFVGITAPLVRPNKFSYDLPQLLTSLFIIFLFIIYLFFQKSLFFIVFDKDKEELNIEFYYLFKTSKLKIKFSDLSYKIKNHRFTELAIFNKNKKIYTITEDDSCLEKKQIEYVIKLLKEYNIHSK